MPRGALASFVLLASLLPAQDAVQRERWIVHFRQRSFDLSAFRAAIQGHAPVAEVDRIVHDLERKAQSERAGFRKAVEHLGGTVLQTWWLIDAAAVTVPPDGREALAALPEVARLEADRMAVPLGPIVTSTNLRNHNAEEVRSILGILGNGVGVAVLDTGLDSSFAGDGRPHPTYYRDGNRTNHGGPGVDGSFLLANLQVGAVGPDDVNDHGTGVSGVIGAWKWNADSYSGNGHAPESQKVGYCIADNAGGGSYFSTITTAWQRVAADKVRYGILAANNSYSGSPYAPDASQQALDAAALNADVMVCVAAGNDGPSSANSQSCANGLAVGATNANDRHVTSFSSRGPLSGDPARFYPDLSAIGSGVVMPQRDVQNAAYIASGTSFASPQVCGAACLVRSADRSLTALQTKAILLAASEDVSAQNPGLDRNAFGVGWLRSDLAVKRALLAGANPVGQITTATSPVRTPLAVTAGQSYTVALAWHRTNLGSNTWSNLDLRVLDGNNVQVAASATTRNLYEKVPFTAATTGTYAVEVSAQSLDAPSVTFALSMGPAGTRYVSGSFAPFGTGCAGTAPVTNVVLPPSLTQAFAGSQSSTPFGAAPCRYQQVFPGNDVPRSFPIGTLAFRQDESAGATAGRTVDLEILIGGTTHDLGTLDLSFGANFDLGPPVTALVRRNVVLPPLPAGPHPGPATFAFPVPLDVPVTLPPGANLLVEIVNRGNSNGNQAFAYPLDATSAGGTARLFAANPAAATGTVAFNTGLVLALVRAGNGTSVPVLGSPGTPEAGTTLTVLLSSAAPNAIALLAFGVSNVLYGGVNLPLSLATAGAPGCSLLVSLDRLLPVVTDARGTAFLGLPIPLAPALWGSAFFVQYLVLDPAANQLGLSSSNGAAATIGGLR